MTTIDSPMTPEGWETLLAHNTATPSQESVLSLIDRTEIFIRKNREHLSLIQMGELFDDLHQIVEKFQGKSFVSITWGNRVASTMNRFLGPWIESNTAADIALKGAIATIGIVAFKVTALAIGAGTIMGAAGVKTTAQELNREKLTSSREVGEKFDDLICLGEELGFRTSSFRVYGEMAKNLRAFRTAYREEHYSYVYNMIQAFKKLESSQEKILESQREQGNAAANIYAFEQTGLNLHVQLHSGADGTELRAFLQQTIAIFKGVYEEAKDTGQLREFFAQGFEVGEVCLGEKLDRIQSFLLPKENPEDAKPTFQLLDKAPEGIDLTTHHLCAYIPLFERLFPNTPLTKTAFLDWIKSRDLKKDLFPFTAGEVTESKLIVAANTLVELGMLDENSTEEALPPPTLDIFDLLQSYFIAKKKQT